LGTYAQEREAEVYCRIQEKVGLEALKGQSTVAEIAKSYHIQAKYWIGKRPYQNDPKNYSPLKPTRQALRWKTTLHSTNKSGGLRWRLVF
jgi:hypothetical protein